MDWMAAQLTLTCTDVSYEADLESGQYGPQECPCCPRPKQGRQNRGSGIRWRTLRPGVRRAGIERPPGHRPIDWTSNGKIRRYPQLGIGPRSAARTRACRNWHLSMLKPQTPNRPTPPRACPPSTTASSPAQCLPRLRSEVSITNLRACTAASFRQSRGLANDGRSKGN
jgi:hypothetical protein